MTITPDAQPSEIYQRLKAPRAAAIAGVLFAVLYGSSIVLIRLAVPADPADAGEWLRVNARILSLGLSFLPFAGIAFLWFMGVIRDRIGALEDQFLSSVFVGSGLLFLALTFVSASLAGAVLTIHAQEPDRLIDSGIYTVTRAAAYHMTNVYAVKMAGVFMVSLGTIWVRTRIMPRWLAFLTYALALGLLLSIASSLWVAIIFPVWVCAVSIYILVLNPRK
jgi:hypothetical protein